jgi:hypothetical protein
MVITTGRGPQENVMTPPFATAETTAAEVQLPGVPLPMVRVGCEVSTARASAGTVAWPPGLPALSSPAPDPVDRWAGAVVCRWPGVGRTLVGTPIAPVGVPGELAVVERADLLGVPEAPAGPDDPPHPATSAPATRQPSTGTTARMFGIARC